MSNDLDGREWVSVSSGNGLPGLSQTKAVKRLCVLCLQCFDAVGWAAGRASGL